MGVGDTSARWRDDIVLRRPDDASQVPVPRSRSGGFVMRANGNRGDASVEAGAGDHYLPLQPTVPAMSMDDGFVADVDVIVEGDANTTQVAGRDMHVHMTAAEEFVRLDADAVGDEVPPRAVGELVSRLAERRLLVLAGACEDKALLARHVALEMGRRESLPVLEW